MKFGVGGGGGTSGVCYYTRKFRSSQIDSDAVLLVIKNQNRCTYTGWHLITVLVAHSAQQ